MRTTRTAGPAQQPVWGKLKEMSPKVFVGFLVRILQTAVERVAPQKSDSNAGLSLVEGRNLLGIKGLKFRLALKH